MDIKKIACTAIRRWNEKRHTDKTAGTRRTTLPETQRPQPAQGVPTAQPVPAAHHLLHRHVLVQSAFRKNIIPTPRVRLPHADEGKWKPTP